MSKNKEEGLHAAALHGPKRIPPTGDLGQQFHFICMHIKLIPSFLNI
jgi:hypothetical protein